MYHSDDKLLFWEKDGHTARQARVQGAVNAVESIDPKRLLAEDANVLIAEIAGRFAVKVPTLDTGNVSYRRTQRRESGRDHWGDHHERLVELVVFEVPFEGDQDLFETKPGRWSSNPPRASLGYNGTLAITVKDTGDAAQMKAAFDQTVSAIEEHLGWHREFWNGLADEIAREAAPRLAARKAKLQRAGEADGGLAGFGFKPKG